MIEKWEFSYCLEKEIYFSILSSGARYSVNWLKDSEIRGQEMPSSSRVYTSYLGHYFLPKRRYVYALHTLIHPTEQVPRLLCCDKLKFRKKLVSLPKSPDRLLTHQASL